MSEAARSRRARHSGLSGKRGEWLAVLYLSAKGYRFTETQPDMQVIYALGLEQEQGIELAPVAVGGTVYTQTRATEDERARLALRILDSKSQAVLFQAQINRQLHNPDMSQENFDRGVAKILEGFPAAR